MLRRLDLILTALEATECLKGRMSQFIQQLIGYLLGAHYVPHTEVTEENKNGKVSALPELTTSNIIE